MATRPTKPLFTARFTLLNTSAYPSTTIQSIFRKDLEPKGYRFYQTPSVRSYKAPFTLSHDGPYPPDDDTVTEIMRVMGPAGKETAIAKDLTNDPYGVRPILEKRSPMITAVTWNIAPPLASTPPQALADLIWSIRKSRVMNPEKYTGLGFTPVVDTWENAPLKLSTYPDKPAIPSALLPPKPKPVLDAPKPAPLPAPYVPPPAPIFVSDVLPASNLFGDWRLWAIFGGLTVATLFGLTDDKKDKS